MNTQSENTKAYRARFPEKAKAHYKVANAIKKGSITRQPCERCGELKTEAHHEDYNRPLDVNWLCCPCHNKRHEEINTALGFVPKPVGTRYVAKGVVYLKNTLKPKAEQLRSEGNSYSQIAAALGISIGSAYKWLNNVNY